MNHRIMESVNQELDYSFMTELAERQYVVLGIGGADHAGNCNQDHRYAGG